MVSERSVILDENSRIRDSALISQRRAEIVRGAIEVFKKKGFHVSTVRDIGDAAGLSQGSLYNYIRSKEDILFLVCDQLVQNYHDVVRTAISVEKDPAKRLTAALRAVIVTMEANQEDLLLLYQEVHALDRKALHAVLSRVAEFIDLFDKLLQEGRDRGQHNFPDPTLAAEIITFLPLIVALRRWRLARLGDSRRVVDGLVEFMSRGLGIVTRPSKGEPDG